MAAAILSGCSTIGNSNLSIQFDKVFTDDETEYTTISLTAEDGTLYTYFVESEGLLNIPEIPKGAYTISINRFGAVETFTETIDKKEMSLDYRLFYDTKGSITEGTHYIINNNEQFMNISKMIGAKAGIYYHLNCSLDFSGYAITPIESFDGILDGRYYGINSGLGYNISNISLIDADSDNMALFRINNGVIKNIVFTSVSIEGKEGVSAICGLNYGDITYCDVTSGMIIGHNYVGSISGIDRGSISNCTSTANIVCSEYYGRIAGISYSNMTLGAYGIRPNVNGITEITEEMSAIDKYLTAMNNWYALDNRAVLETAEMTMDVTDTVSAAINQLKGAFAAFSLQQIALNIVKGLDFNATEVIIARRIYEGDYEEGLSRILVSGGGYTKATSFDDILNQFLVIPQFAEMLNGIDMQFPFGFAAYYNEADNERGEFQITDDATVLSSGNVENISYILGDEVYTVNITNDLIEYALAEDISNDDVNKILAYIAEAKGEIMNLSTLDFSDPLAILDVSDEIHSNGTYKFTMTIDPNIAYKYVIDRIQLAMDTELAGTIGEGTTINAVFAKAIALTVEIYDNGNLKSVILNDLDATITINLTAATKERIRQVVASVDFDDDGYANDVTNFQIDNVKVKVSGKISDKYSYSKTDTDIDIYLSDFDKENKIRIIDKMSEEQQNPENID